MLTDLQMDFVLSPSCSSGADDPETAAEKILRSHVLDRCALLLFWQARYFQKLGCKHKTECNMIFHEECVFWSNKRCQCVLRLCVFAFLGRVRH